MAVRLTDKILPLNDGFVGMVDSDQVIVDASGFTGNLSVTDTDLQTALATIDGLTLGGAWSDLTGTPTALLLDQTTPQHIINGKPIFDEGITSEWDITSVKLGVTLGGHKTAISFDSGDNFSGVLGAGLNGGGIGFAGAFQDGINSVYLANLSYAIETTGDVLIGGDVFADNLSGTNTGDQVGDGVTITGAGTIADPFVAVSGGSQTPWTSDIDGAAFDLFNIGGIYDNTSPTPVLSIDPNLRQLLYQNGTNVAMDFSDFDKVSIGAAVSSVAQYSTVVGVTASAPGTNSVAVGHGAYAGSAYGTAVGEAATIFASTGVAIGNASRISSGATNGIAVGNSAQVDTDGGVSLGDHALVTGVGGIAIGGLSKASAEGAVNIGWYYGSAFENNVAHSVVLGGYNGSVNEVWLRLGTGGIYDLAGTPVLSIDPNNRILYAPDGTTPIVNYGITYSPGVFGVEFPAGIMDSFATYSINTGWRQLLDTSGSRVAIDYTGTYSSTAGISFNVILSNTALVPSFAYGVYDNAGTPLLSINPNTRMLYGTTGTTPEEINWTGNGVSFGVGIIDYTNRLNSIDPNLRQLLYQNGTNVAMDFSDFDKISIGAAASSVAQYATLVGIGGSASGTNSVVIGHSAYVGSAYGIAVGESATVFDSSSIAIGSNSRISSGGSLGIAIGNVAEVGAATGMALGDHALVTGVGGIAIGGLAKASAEGAVNIGWYYGSAFDNSVAHSAILGGYDGISSNQIFFRATSSGIELPTSAQAFCIGDSATDGSWRLVVSGNNLNVERRESSVWVKKGEFQP